MKKFLVLFAVIITLSFIACSNYTCDITHRVDTLYVIDTGNGYFIFDYNIGNVYSALVGIWHRSSNISEVWYVFNSDGNGFYYNEEISYARFMEFRWGTRDGVLYMRNGRLVDAVAFEITNNGQLLIGGSIYSIKDRMPVLRTD